MQEAYLDANVVLRHLTADPPEMAEEALDLLTAAEEGRVRLHLLAVTVAEIVWVLESFYEHPREAIAETVAAFLEAEGLVVEQADRLQVALALYRTHGVDFADAHLAAAARTEGPSAVCSFDRDLERFAGVERWAPAEV